MELLVKCQDFIAWQVIRLEAEASIHSYHPEKHRKLTSMINEGQRLLAEVEAVIRAPGTTGS